MYTTPKIIASLDVTTIAGQALGDGSTVGGL